MCGRFTNDIIDEELNKIFGVPGVLPKREARYNIAPTQMIEAVVEQKAERILTQLKWGLIPSWAKDDSLAGKMINARAETIAEKPSFKNAFKSRRCIIPASGFYEWQKTSAGKQPFYFYLKDESPFGLAGLYENWLDKQTGELVETCTIITTEANEVLEPVHERMPVILKAKDYDFWLDEKVKDIDRLQSLLVPYPAEEMESHKVGKGVNIPDNNSPELIKPSAQS
jgi:putative SOS response-associated peptidase YedK